MNILFFISVNSNGVGGHFHSLNQISRLVAKDHSVNIVSIGLETSKVLEANPFFLEHIYYEELINFIKIKRKFKNIVSLISPDILHYFDTNSYCLTKPYFNNKCIKVVLTKCGGPNFKNFPFVDNVIVFSEENLEWIQRFKKFNKSNIKLIPNRVERINLKDNYKRIIKDDNNFNLVRICRIGVTYYESITSSIKLVEKLNRHGVKNVRLYIIGTVETEAILKKIENVLQNTNVDVVILTETKYTIEASNMLYLADAVLGVGRGLMEASSLKLPILTFDKNHNLPILLTEDNYKEAWRTNFSGRSEINKENNFNNIIKMINDNLYYMSLSKFSYHLFETKFDIYNAQQLYNNYYENILPSTSGPDVLSIIKVYKKVIMKQFFHYK